MSGAYKNAGDFLIQKRCEQLISHLLPECEISVYKRNEMLDKLDRINATDVIAFCGGPIYQEEPERHIPLKDRLSDVKPPIMIVGGGWYGRDNCASRPYAYEISEFGKKLFEKAEKQGYGLACRDYLTYKMLRKKGFSRVYLTGCPAWYNLDYLDSEELLNSRKEIERICVSDPAQRENYQSVPGIIQILREKYPEAEIDFVFHRGILADQLTDKKTEKTHRELVGFLEKNGIALHDIAYQADKMVVYDQADLHVGFRVHAHIYCLSRRQRSILIEEDGRGAGMNQTLGMPPLLAYNDMLYFGNRYVLKGMQILGKRKNPYLAQEVGNQLDLLKETDDQYLKNAFRLMKRYYQNMEAYICQLL